MKFKSISTQLQLTFLVIVLIILLILSTITVMGLSQQKSQARHELDDSVTLLNELVKLKSDDALALATVYAQDERIISALKSNNRTKFQQLSILYLMNIIL